MKGLDLSKFQKVHEDGKTATMKHKDGHTLVIALTALPKIQQQQLKRLKLAEGTPDGPLDSSQAETPRDLDPTLGAPPPQAPAAPVTINISNGAPQAQPPSSGGQLSAGVPGHSILSQTGGGSPQAPMMAPAPPAPAAPAEDPVTAAVAGQAERTMGATGLQQQAVREQQAVDTSKAQAQAGLEGDYIGQRQQVQQQDVDNYLELKKHTDEFKNYIQSNPINPRAYEENQSSGQKTLTALGLLFGGLKQGFAGGSNPAMDYLNSQIDRDINAQKANMENRKTLYGAYEHLYQNSTVATNLTKVSLNDILVHKAQMAAAKVGTAQAKATADGLAAQKDLENAKLRAEAAAIIGVHRAQGQSSRQPQGGPEGKPTGAAGLPPITPLLKPGAQEVFNSQSFNPLAEKDYADIKPEFTKAQNADRALRQLPGIFDNMKENAWVSSDAVQQVGGLAKLPFGVGEVVHGPVELLAARSPTYKRYASAQTQLEGELLNALRGTDASPAMVKEIVQRNSPWSDDSPATLKQKRRAIEMFVKNAVNRALLHKHNMAHPEE